MTMQVLILHYSMSGLLVQEVLVFLRGTSGTEASR